MGFIIFLVGLLIGSFLNVCIYRIPQGESIVYPSSHCPRCGTTLRALDLIPILSFFAYGGKCKYCGEGISMRYPSIELINGLLYYLLYHQLGLSLELIPYGLLASLLLTISLIDYDHQIIPDGLVIFGFVIGLLYKIIDILFHQATFGVLNSIGGLLLGGGLFLLIAIVSNGGMGGGDIKLMAMLGFWLGIKGILLVMLLSFIIGAIVSIFLLLLKKKGGKDAIPFGPFIALGTMIVLAWGTEIINWYMQNFLS